MKIQDLKATVVSVPLKSDLTSVRSPGPQDRLRTLVVKVETDEGVTGEVYTCNSANGMSIPFREMRQLVVGACKELAVGEDPFAIERVWERLSQVSARTENKEAAMRAISAVDIALWDVIGKVSNMPLHKLLGGYKEELPAMGDGGANWEERDPESMTEFMVRQKEMGYAGTKFNVGKAPVEAGIKRIEAIRRATGDDFLLACDAGQAWTPEEAIKFAKGVEEYDIAWFEEPVRYDDVEGMRRVREATTIPVTAGQSELNGFGCLKLMRGGAVDYLNVESCKAGGITEWRRIAAAAQLFGVRMVHHKEPQISVHLLSALPHTFCAEFFQDPERDPFWHNMYLGHPEVKDGKIRPPDAPGLGIRIDQSFVDRYREE